MNRRSLVAKAVDDGNIQAAIFEFDSWDLLHLPERTLKKVMVYGINEPDDYWRSISRFAERKKSE